jgi:2-iminobutanoate/2-iminopropanoate deaminase
MRDVVATTRAPQAIGPYSQAVVTDGWVFCSGQIPLDAVSGQLVDGEIADQTRQVFANLQHVLAAAGATFDDVVKTTVYLADMNDFAAMNEVYGTVFASPAPARSTVQAARLPRDARVEIDVVARPSAPLTFPPRCFRAPCARGPVWPGLTAPRARLRAPPQHREATSSPSRGASGR